MITIEEVGTLLVLISYYDYRTVGREDVEAWYAVAAESRWPSYESARRAAVKHQANRPDDRIRPGHITAVLAEVRDDASRRYRQPEMPGHLTGDAAEKWEIEQRRAYRAWYFAEWAAGNDWPDATPPAIGTYGS